MSASSIKWDINAGTNAISVAPDPEAGSGTRTFNAATSCMGRSTCCFKRVSASLWPIGGSASDRLPTSHHVSANVSTLRSLGLLAAELVGLQLRLVELPNDASPPPTHPLSASAPPMFRPLLPEPCATPSHHFLAFVQSLPHWCFNGSCRDFRHCIHQEPSVL